MREFFHGWRRKLGCVTLVMALVLMVGWMRSPIVHDGVAVRTSGHVTWNVLSRVNTLHLGRIITTEDDPAEPTIQWYCTPRPPGNGLYTTEMPATKWRWRFAGFGVCDQHRRTVDFTILNIPYWFPTGTFTILSAWLFISKPRPRPQVATPSPDHA